MSTAQIPVKEIVDMLQVQANGLFLVKDMDLIQEDSEFWEFRLTIVGTFETQTRRVRISKRALYLFTILNNGIKWSD